MLEPEPNEAIRSRPYSEQPYWHVERARIGSTGRVPVELIVNGYAVQELELEADGTLQAPAHEGRVCILLSGWTYLAPEHIF